MPQPCEHNVPESKRGAGPCDIRAEVKLRNGNPNWWCRTHGMKAYGPGGEPLERCPASWLDPIPEQQILSLDASDGELAIWGAIPPAVEVGAVEEEIGKVHVHHRVSAGATKDIDGSYEIVRVHHGASELVIEGMAAVAYSISELSQREVTPLSCPHCGEVHIDEQKFATFAHVKHQCNSCGRNFWDQEPSISNPLSEANRQLGLPVALPPQRPDRPLDLRTMDYQGIAMWPSNSAIVSTMSRPEEEGIHVHAWDLQGVWLIDETYSSVIIDGEIVDEQQLRVLAVQRALAHGAPIVALDCDECGRPLVTSRETWLEPTTTHSCSRGHETRTKRRSFVNPLVLQFPVMST